MTRIICPQRNKGDLLTAAVERRPDVIGLIDGLFLQSLSTWHKEILYAIDRGISVYGASSMGALRAAETAEYGMIGVGEIYRQFASGELNDDNEVAVSHGPAERRYVQLSEPMVNVRATLRAAEHAGAITPERRGQLTEIAKKVYFTERTFAGIFNSAASAGVPRAELDVLSKFVSTSYVDQKRQDAIQLLRIIAALPDTEPRTPPEFEFARNSSFITLYDRDRRVQRGQTEVPLEAIANYLAIHDPDFDDLNFAALNRALALEFAFLLGVTVSETDIGSESNRFMRRRGLAEGATFSAWLAENDISAEEYHDLMKQVALCRRLHRWYVIATWVNRTTSLVLDDLRLAGRYAEWADRAAAQERMVHAEMAEAYVRSVGWASLDEMLKEHHEWTGWSPPIDARIWFEEDRLPHRRKP